MKGFRSVARKIIVPGFLLFMMLTIVFCWLVYRRMYYLVLKDNKEYLRDIAESISLGFHRDYRDDEDLISDFERHGEQACDSFYIDYVSLYVSDEAKGTVEFLSIKYSPDIEEDKKKVSDSAKGIVLKDTKISEAEKRVLSGQSKLEYMDYDNKYGYELVAVVPVNLPSGRRALMTVERSLGSIRSFVFKSCRIQICIILLLYAISSAVLYIILKKTVLEPARAVSEAMNNFITSGNRVQIKMDESKNDEFGVINRAFNDMADNIDRYIQNISSLNKEREQQGVEMNIASRIQQGLLPKGVAHFSWAEIHATMKPALDVGGDLYDYLPLEDGRLFVMIADVAGKGVSAAVFMAVTITLLHQFARMRMEPSEILENTNDVLASKNPLMLFVTAFVGIYDSRSGLFSYSNAGHNMPFAVSARTSVVKSPGGTVLGLFEGQKYGQSAIRLAAGDTLFMYTDGVTEAVNERNEFYGVGRLEKVISDNYLQRAGSLVEIVGESVQEFAANTKQFDDITMIALTVKDEETISLVPEMGEFHRIKDLIFASKMPQRLKKPMCLVAEEVFVNICSYGYTDATLPSGNVDFTLVYSDCIKLRFEDNGVKYNPLAEISNVADYDVDSQIGGLGKNIIVSVADDIDYNYENGRNVLTIIKHKESDFYDNQQN